MPNLKASLPLIFLNESKKGLSRRVRASFQFFLDNGSGKLHGHSTVEPLWDEEAKHPQN